MCMAEFHQYFVGWYMYASKLGIANIHEQISAVPNSVGQPYNDLFHIAEIACDHDRNALIISDGCQFLKIALYAFRRAEIRCPFRDVIDSGHNPFGMEGRKILLRRHKIKKFQLKFRIPDIICPVQVWRRGDDTVNHTLHICIP